VTPKMTDNRAGPRKRGRDNRRHLEQQDAGAPSGTEGVPGSGYVMVDEAAVLPRVCPKTVRNRIKSRVLEAYRHGRRILIPRNAIERLIKRGRI